ncbi:CatB-related O-acetyltransferase [Algoriphagus litoralis]|uniref:CatB-related O-acetyltransferase n=1 Tax=Algoriphagus litoralis TaxID=2202829 RepID=UPI000DBAAFFF|nr:CatB-related O-acetyltransferase [Algoriphagus litoralis]
MHSFLRFFFNFFSISKNSTIESSAVVYPFSVVSNSYLGSYSYVSYFSKINNTKIGKFCSIGQNSKMGLGRHPTNFISTNPVLYSALNPLKESWTSNDSGFEEHLPISIGSDVWIGANVTILDGITIGDGAIIGAHSLVTKDVSPYSIVGGVPAKVIKMRFSSDIIAKLLELKWWECSIETLKKCASMGLFSKDVNLDLLSRVSDFIKDSSSN